MGTVADPPVQLSKPSQFAVPCQTCPNVSGSGLDLGTIADPYDLAGLKVGCHAENVHRSGVVN